MSAAATKSRSWQEDNRRYLAIALDRVRYALESAIAQAQNQPPKAPPATAETLADLAATMPSPPTLVTICHHFRLTPFERDVLLMSAGVELSASFAELCGLLQGSPNLTYPTFSLALATLPQAHWSALAPRRPLRYWRLLEVKGDALTQSRLQIDERILHYLNGVSYLDDRLQGLITAVATDELLPPSHQQLAEQIVHLWSGTANAKSAVVQLGGDRRQAKRPLAAQACQILGLKLSVLKVEDIPSTATERDALVRLWEREAILSQSALLLDAETLEGRDRLRQFTSFIEALQGRLLIARQEPLPVLQRPSLQIVVEAPTAGEQRALWESALTHQALLQPRQLDQLITQFHLSASTIRTVGEEVNLQVAAGKMSDRDLFDTLWQTCRMQARTQLDELAQAIVPQASWHDLVLPQAQTQLLKDLTAQVRQRATVYTHWGFAVRGANGLGISALFAGPSGTGKTLAAEVLAHELQLDLYRIDLSQVVSKYIGETEKNLRQVFDAAESSGAILLFDEADALFGKRSEVKDSHDRYANIEVSYLLQRMEAYRGLAILTTNLKNAIDTAFLRRIRFVVQFPFPGPEQRRAIWQRMFPPQLPTQDLNWEQLAKLNLPGGNIRNIALNAAFLAADADTAVQMSHLLRAAQTEYSKLEKTLTAAEIGGWE